METENKRRARARTEGALARQAKRNAARRLPATATAAEQLAYDRGRAIGVELVEAARWERETMFQALVDITTKANTARKCHDRAKAAIRAVAPPIGSDEGADDAT